MHPLISKRRRGRVWELDNHHKICAIVWSDSKSQIVTLRKLLTMKWLPIHISFLWSAQCKPHQTRTTGMQGPIFYFQGGKRSWSMTLWMDSASRMSLIFLMWLRGMVTPNCYRIKAKAIKRFMKLCSIESFKTMIPRSNLINPLSPSGNYTHHY